MNEASTANTLQGGVMFRVQGELFFLSASVAMKVMPIPEMAHVPGGPAELRGVALVDGDMIPVVKLETDDSGELPTSRPDRRAVQKETGGAMLVCSVLGETIGLVGIEVVAAGRFELDGTTGELRLGEKTARLFDLAGVIARVRAGRWAV